MTLYELCTTNKDTVKELQDFLIDFLTQEAVKKVFAREDTSGVAEAKEMLDKAFEEMDIQLGVKKTEPKVMHNVAR